MDKLISFASGGRPGKSSLWRFWD